MKRVAISQSNYIPWRGYFDLIASVDTFVIYDDMQYTKRDWRNRNKIKTSQGTKWLTIPVQVKGKYLQKINQTIVSDPSWTTSHWAQLQQHYRSAKHFKEISGWLKPLYLEADFPTLSEWNRHFMQAVCIYLGITTEIRDSREFELAEGKTQRLSNICQQLEADHYISGPAARDYIDPSYFDNAGIRISWADYSAYPEYQQLNGKFEHSVTILDLLFNLGSDSSRYMKHCN